MKILVTMDQAVKKEFTQTGKIKSSELSAYNKVVVHNTFSVLTLIPTIGVLDCTVGKIKDFDIKAQKKLISTQISILTVTSTPSICKRALEGVV